MARMTNEEKNRIEAVHTILRALPYIDGIGADDGHSDLAWFILGAGDPWMGSVLRKEPLAADRIAMAFKSQGHPEGQTALAAGARWASNQKAPTQGASRKSPKADRKSPKTDGYVRQKIRAWKQAKLKQNPKGTAMDLTGRLCEFCDEEPADGRVEALVGDADAHEVDGSYCCSDCFYTMFGKPYPKEYALVTPSGLKWTN